MGERAPYVRRAVLTLNIGDVSPDFAGLYVDVRRPTIGAWNEWRELINREASTVEEDTQDGGQIIDHLAAHLIGWNLTVEHVVNGRLVEREANPDRSGLAGLDPALLQAIGAAYTGNVGRVAAPLPRPSIDGRQSVEGSIPMETLLESPTN